MRAPASLARVARSSSPVLVHLSIWLPGRVDDANGPAHDGDLVRR